MKKELIHDPILLSAKSSVATADDLQTVRDLLDTLLAHRSDCVGMAANMIGVRKRIIAFLDESGALPMYTVMLNPEIIGKDTPYEAFEGCLSLLGGPRKCMRYKTVKVKFQTTDLVYHTKIYTGWTAQIIQHEIDHCNGILI
ncbi:MAG: peptide deformylase [Clostridia bacterium]|nr:peptide deformylase [Clostridia bacterium]